MRLAEAIFDNQNDFPANRSKILMLHNPRTSEDIAVCLYNENKKRMVIYMREKKNHMLH